MKQERRYLKTEFRVESGTSPKITGYAAKFNSRSQDLGGFYEVIAPTAFDASLDEDVRALFNHDPNLILGRTSSGTLKLSVDGTGLRYEVDPPNTTIANDLMVSMKRGDVNQSSFGFYCLEDTWDMDESGEIVRTVLKAQLFDVSPVTYPAYLSSTSEARSLFPDGADDIQARIAQLRAASDQDDGCECNCTYCEDDNCVNCDFDGCEFDSCDPCGMRSKRVAVHAEIELRNANTILLMQARVRLALAQD